jgi:hypothetical protein
MMVSASTPEKRTSEFNASEFEDVNAEYQSDRFCEHLAACREQPPRVLIVFPDALSLACVSQSYPAAPASLTLSWNKRPFAHFSTSAGRVA